MDQSVIRKIFIGLAAAALSFFAVTIFFNSKQFAINRANKLMSEFKTAKALEIIRTARNQNKHSDPKLDFLYIYALIKNNQYKKAIKELDKVESFPKEYKQEITDFINLLSTKGETDLLIKALPKTYKINLSQKTLIQISRQRSSTDEEIKFLEASISYLQNKPNSDKKTRKVEEYLLNRYIDSSKILVANNNAKKALNYLQKAEKLSIVENSHYKDDLYLSLGLTYKAIGKNNLAFDYLKKSAEAGNSLAKDMIHQINTNYIPKHIKDRQEETNYIEFEFE